MITKLIAVRVPVETYDKFRERCVDQDISVSEAVRQQIDSSLSSAGKDTAPAATPPDTTEVEGADVDRLALLEDRLIHAVRAATSELDDRLARLEEERAKDAEKLGQLDDVLTDLTEGEADRETEDGIAPEAEELPEEGEGEVHPAAREIQIPTEHMARVDGKPEPCPTEDPESEKEEGHWPLSIFFYKKSDKK